MSMDNRLNNLLEAYRLAAENAVNDDGKERAKREGEIREHVIGDSDAAPDPWPDAVRSASEAPDLDAAVVGGCLALARGALFRRMARSCTVPRCGPVVG